MEKAEVQQACGAKGLRPTHKNSYILQAWLFVTCENQGRTMYSSFSEAHMDQTSFTFFWQKATQIKF